MTRLCIALTSHGEEVQFPLHVCIFIVVVLDIYLCAFLEENSAGTQIIPTSKQPHANNHTQEFHLQATIYTQTEQVLKIPSKQFHVTGSK